MQRMHQEFNSLLLPQPLLVFVVLSTDIDDGGERVARCFSAFLWPLSIMSLSAGFILISVSPPAERPDTLRINDIEK